MRKAIAFCGCLVVVMALPAFAGVEFFDVPSAEWDAALANAGKISKGTVDFDDDPDYGIAGMDGPLTSAGLFPVSAGVVLDNMTIFGPVHLGANDLVAVGPSAGFGNPKNLIAANYFTDSLQIDIDDPDKTAISIMVGSLLGGPNVDVSVFDGNGNLLGVAVGVTNNTSVGILATGGDTIGALNLNDPGVGAEGFMTATAYNVPEPASLALLALGAVAAVRRRR